MFSYDFRMSKNSYFGLKVKKDFGKFDVLDLF